MVGLQGAGKSTWAREHLADTHAVVSKDDWPRARRREARQQRVVAELLATGRSVVVDNTNPSPDERAALLAAGRAAGVPVRAVWLDTPFEICLARNDAREGRARVPLVGVHATRARPDSRPVRASLLPSPAATSSSTTRPTSARFSAQPISSCRAVSRR